MQIKQIFWEGETLIDLLKNNWPFWKHFWNIWNFILLFTKEDSALKVP